MQITVYGCSDYFNEIQSGDYDEVVQDLCSRFVILGRKQGLRLESMINREFIVVSKSIPSESRYFAEIALITNTNDHDEISNEALEIVIMIWGDLWDQFVHSCIDSEGSVGTRLICGTKRLEWITKAKERKH